MAELVIAGAGPTAPHTPAAKLLQKRPPVGAGKAALSTPRETWLSAGHRMRVTRDPLAGRSPHPTIRTQPPCLRPLCPKKGSAAWTWKVPYALPPTQPLLLTSAQRRADPLPPPPRPLFFGFTTCRPASVQQNPPGQAGRIAGGDLMDVQLWRPHRLVTPTVRAVPVPPELGSDHRGSPSGRGPCNTAIDRSGRLAGVARAATS